MPHLVRACPCTPGGRGGEGGRGATQQVCSSQSPNTSAAMEGTQQREPHYAALGASLGSPAADPPAPQCPQIRDQVRGCSSAPLTWGRASSALLGVEEHLCPTPWTPGPGCCNKHRRPGPAHGREPRCAATESGTQEALTQWLVFGVQGAGMGGCAGRSEGCVVGSRVGARGQGRTARYCHDTALFFTRSVGAGAVEARLSHCPVWSLRPSPGLSPLHGGRVCVKDPGTGHHDNQDEPQCALPRLPHSSPLPSSGWPAPRLLQDTQCAVTSSDLKPSRPHPVPATAEHPTTPLAWPYLLWSSLGPQLSTPSSPHSSMSLSAATPPPRDAETQALLHPDPIQAPYSKLQHVPRMPRPYPKLKMGTPPPPLHLQILWALPSEHLEVTHHHPSTAPAWASPQHPSPLPWSLPLVLSSLSAPQRPPEVASYEHPSQAPHSAEFSKDPTSLG